MNTQTTKLYLLLGALLTLGITTGCTIAATPATVTVGAAPTHVVHHTTVAPARVYHNGSWLYYRTDGYYYSRGNTWHVASTVPTHVHTYHRPGRPAHVVSRSARPTHVVRTSRPTHVRSGPTHVVHTGQPVHVNRTVSPRSRTTTSRSSGSRASGTRTSTRSSGSRTSTRRTYRR
ncbi:MAG: hypothetical protein ACI81R_001431 [Bradymonadia bacterium]|jgi:hypothetical protein